MQALHRSRMAPYLSEAGGNDKDALDLYLWNLKLTAAVQEVLGVTEVILRNAMDRELQRWNSKKAGAKTSWLMQEPETPLRGLVNKKRKQALHRAKKEANSRPYGHPRRGAAVCHDDVLAQLMFGTWKDLLPNHAPNAGAAQHNINRERMWNEALQNAFPYEADLDGRKTYWRVAHLHLLRNRVSHMDSLLNIDVKDRIQDAFKLVGSVDPALRDWVTGFSRVSEIYRDRPRARKGP